MSEAAETPIAGERRGFSFKQVLLIVFIAVLLAVTIVLLAVKYYLFPTQFEPVELSAKEAQVLRGKLRHLGLEDFAEGGKSAHVGPPLTPEPYSEIGASRTVKLSEKELNAMLAKNTDLAQQLAIDLSDDLISAKLLLPLDPDFPVFGGETLRVRAGLGLLQQEGRLAVILRGVSVMGVPLPNAWLGGLKNIDLVKEFGGQPGFWKSFADGIENIQVEEGQLLIHLRE